VRDDHCIQAAKRVKALPVKGVIWFAEPAWPRSPSPWNSRAKAKPWEAGVLSVFRPFETELIFCEIRIRAISRARSQRIIGPNTELVVRRQAEGVGASGNTVALGFGLPLSDLLRITYLDQRRCRSQEES